MGVRYPGRRGRSSQRSHVSGATSRAVPGGNCTGGGGVPTPLSRSRLGNYQGWPTCEVTVSRGGVWEINNKRKETP